ncbi:M28 family metallopeptidase [Mucilaginibacter aquatilis]|uniref:Carboxypeptidase Q n=1 Tax=Mucilaginibacter aquatilis TaxID=1517760 RepID=A0A6I4IC04_9SPHI|nr:M20/M25/M40 family metallo-hydrolase [Mucilaginibacter aquatilis]MVN92642.1 M20/M25/M40 family metallo-hydrolase [Mucilaginibacter aquatilis]
MKKNLLFSLFVCSFSLSALAQEVVDAAAVNKIREEGLNRSQVMKTAFYLTDVAGPRLSGSPGLRKAQDWALNELKKYGLTNGKLEPWGKFGKGWQVNKNYAAITVPYYHAIIAIPKAWTSSTKGAIKGDVTLLKIDTVTDLQKYKGQLAGKIVIIDNNAPALVRSKNPDLSRYTDEELAKMAAATSQPAGGRAAQRGGGNPQMAAFMAARLKAAAMRTAISQFFQQENVALILSQGRGTDGTVFTSNGASYADTAKAALPELETSGEDFLRIVRLLRAGQKVSMEADIQTQFFNDDLKGYNVIAEIPGTDKKLKEQVVMLGGHFDSWHAGTGATDNAAGSAVMMEAVRILKAIGFKPKRTIRIALWSSEEQGLFGSRGYVAEHFGKRDSLKAEQGKVSAYYNLDNGTGKIRGIYLQGNAGVGPVFNSWLEPFKDLGATTVTISNTGGTDHQSFDAVNIPGFQFIQDGMDYNTRTHHSNQDTYDRLVEDDLKQAATIVASFVYHTAQRAQMLPRKEAIKPAN